MTSIVFNVSYIPMTFAAIYCYREYSKGLNFRVACSILLVGAWLRAFAGTQFWIVLLGQVIISFTYPFLLSSVTLVCYSWLSAKERLVWVQILALAMPLGTMVSFLEAGVMYHGKGVDYLTQTQEFIWLQNMQLTVSAVGFIAFFRERPAIPPSAEANVKAKKIDLKESFGQCFANKGFMIVCVNFACMYGAFASMSSTYSLLFTSFNPEREAAGLPLYKTAEISLYGVTTTIAGVSCSFTASMLLKKYGKFLIPVRVFIALTGIMMTIGIICVPEGTYVVAGILLMLIGMTLVPLIPLSYAYASKLTFPMDPPTTQGILLMSGMGFGAIEGILGTFICQYDSRILVGMWILQAVIAFGNTFRMPKER